MTSQTRGIALILLAYVLLSTEMIAIHQVGHAVGTLEVAFLRSLGSVALVAALSRKIGFRVFKTEMPGLQVIRSCLSLLGFWAFIYAFSHLPLLNATALSYTQALFVTGFAAVLLTEPIGLRRWSASLVGLCGALIVIHPTFTAWDSVYLVAMAAPFFNGAALTVTKLLENRDSPLTVMAWLSATYLAFSSMALADWTSPSLTEWPWLIAIMIIGPLGTYIRILAIRQADISVLAPYDYTRLVINALVAVVEFRELPDATTITGVIIIIAGCLIVTLFSDQTFRKANAAALVRNISSR
ncbi:DMT family transporter [Bradyrhizobium sp. HKCCYLS1011]|uniref:DMT family transporter n=1 Tax=Bradyrhizobium sp. HKCCYLS1011 TaxID=3420733 RepID=UPI003EBF439F